MIISEFYYNNKKWKNGYKLTNIDKNRKGHFRAGCLNVTFECNVVSAGQLGLVRLLRIFMTELCDGDNLKK